MSWNDIASVAYSTEPSPARVCHNITTSNVQIHESLLLIYIQNPLEMVKRNYVHTIHDGRK